MKKIIFILLLSSACIFYSCLFQRSGREALYDLQAYHRNFPDMDSIISLPDYGEVQGNPDSGYKYLTEGGIFQSGIPYSLYKIFFGKLNRNVISKAGFNHYVINDFTKTEVDGKLFAEPGCLHCHAQVFDGKLVIGLGNTYGKYQVNYNKYFKAGNSILRFLYKKDSKEWKNTRPVFSSLKKLAPYSITETQGLNPAHRMGDVLASQMDPVSFRSRSDSSYFSFPSVVVPTDITPWWHARKKSAVYISAFARGNLAKQVMIATLLTLKDTTEAAIVFERMKDVWAYLEKLEPPKYPLPVNTQLAEKGEEIFNKNCSACHGTYGKEEVYTTKLIPHWMVGTDSLFLKYYSIYKGFGEWYNSSWFATSNDPAFFEFKYGYVAQPLDGIWITAPYFHNGSVPTLEAVLNSKLRPRYWKRNFDTQEYNYKNPGWEYKNLRKPGGRKAYNTDIPGYGNYGHYFGDHLNNEERKAVIEFLKTI